MAFVPYFFAENLPEDLSDKAKAQTAREIDSSWSMRAMDADVNSVDWNDELAVAATGIIEQSSAIRAGKITSQRLTELYLGRLKKFDPVLRCVVTLTEELAMQQAIRPTRN